MIGVRGKHSFLSNAVTSLSESGSQRALAQADGMKSIKQNGGRAAWKHAFVRHFMPWAWGFFVLALLETVLFQLQALQNGGRPVVRLGRILLGLLLVGFFVVFRPSSRLYRIRSDTRSRWQNGVLALLILVFTTVCGLMAFADHHYMNGYVPKMGHWFDSEQYDVLARSILHGHTWLDLKVDPALTRMANPYSFANRIQLARQGHVFYYDHAYFDGHYYCYFGVVPALLTFVPFRLLTGHDLPLAAALTVFIALVIVFGTLLVRRCARDFFPDASLGVVLLATFGLWMGSMLVYYAWASDTYSIPMAAATGFVYAGLWCWLSSRRANGTVQPWLLFLGSLFLALEIGTRPQFALAWLLVFPLFWQQTIRRRTLFSRKSVAASLCLVTPFVAVGAGVAAYNMGRFHSPFNFGNNYNLTSYDVVHARPQAGLLPAQIFNQLFQPSWITAKFPFLQPVDNNLPAAHGPSPGGYYVAIPFCLLAFLVFFLHKQLARQRVWGLSLTMMILSFIPLVFDMLKGGNFVRYSGDFAYLASLSAIIVLLVLESETRNRCDKPAILAKTVQKSKSAWLAGEDDELPAPGSGFNLVVTVLLVLLALSAAIQFFSCFLVIDRQSSWTIRHPALFRRVAEWFTAVS